MRWVVKGRSVEFIMTGSFRDKRVICPSCGTDHISQSWNPVRLSGEKTVLWCADCGFGWQHPLPTPQDVRNYYEHLPPYILQGAQEKELGFSRRIHRINALRPGRGRLLDIGSGLGYFLKLAEKDGWDVLGVEPQEWSVKYSQEQLGLEICQGGVDDLDTVTESFDVVTLWDVWEHVHEPLTFIKTCTDLVAPGGLLVLSIPNASGWPARLFKGRWRYVMSTHLNYFTTSYVERVMQDQGFLVERTDHTLKLQSLIQGFGSVLPMEFDTERLLRLGRKGSIERGRPEQARSDGGLERSPLILRILGRIRRIVLELNLVRLPGSIGDLMDFYCRKR